MHIIHALNTEFLCVYVYVLLSDATANAAAFAKP